MPYVALRVISNLQELANQFRDNAEECRQVAQLPRWRRWHGRDRLLIEAETWERAATIVETTLLTQRANDNR